MAIFPPAPRPDASRFRFEPHAADFTLESWQSHHFVINTA